MKPEPPPRQSVPLPPPAKNHHALFLALAAIAISVALAIGIIVYSRMIFARQSDPTIVLPIAPPEPPVPESEMIVLTLTTDGVVHFGDTELSEDDLRRLIAGNPGKRVLLRARRDVQYPILRALMVKLSDFGARNITFSVVER